MNSMMMMDRGGMTMPGMGMPSMPSMPSGMMGMGGMMSPMMVPNCTIMMEKCEGGMKMMCRSTDKMAVGMMQSLCSMMNGAMMSCCMMMNGMMMAGCNMAMGMTRCDMMEDGVMITCTSGDMDCCKMIQSCCEMMMKMMEAGCTCCVMMNNMPMCCGCC